MKENKISVEIDCPVSEAFEFVINPVNAALWMVDIVKGEASESPIKVGTEYRNLNKKDVWVDYKVVTFKKDKVFELKAEKGHYHVRYVFGSMPDNKTKLDYYEWVSSGYLEYPLYESVLEKLKDLIEKSAHKE